MCFRRLRTQWFRDAAIELGAEGLRERERTIAGGVLLLVVDVLVLVAEGVDDPVRSVLVFCVVNAELQDVQVRQIGPAHRTAQVLQAPLVETFLMEDMVADSAADHYIQVELLQADRARLHIPARIHSDGKGGHECLEVGDVDGLLLLLHLGLSLLALRAAFAVEEDDEEDGDCHEQPARHVAQNQEELVAGQRVDLVGDVDVLLRRTSEVQHEDQLFGVGSVGLVGQSQGSLDVEHVHVRLQELAAAPHCSHRHSLVDQGCRSQGIHDIQPVRQHHIDVEPQLLLYFRTQQQVACDPRKQSYYRVRTWSCSWVVAVEDETRETAAVGGFADAVQRAGPTRRYNQIWHPCEDQKAYPAPKLHHTNQYYQNSLSRLHLTSSPPSPNASIPSRFLRLYSLLFPRPSDLHVIKAWFG